MRKYRFDMDTGGHCLICLRAMPSRPTLAIGTNNGYDTSPARTGNLFSFGNLCQYLDITWKNILGGAMPVPAVGDAEMKGPLCEKCAPSFETVSRLFLELEVIQMKLQSCVESIHDTMIQVDRNENIGSDTNNLTEFRRKMLSDPQTLLHYGIVMKLRDSILEKASKLKDKVRPRVILKKVEHDHGQNMLMEVRMPNPVAEEQSLPSPLTSTTYRESSERYLHRAISSEMQVDLEPMTLMDDINVLLAAESDDNTTLLECDICHLNVTDLSTHLYTVHFEADQNIVEAPLETGIGHALALDQVMPQAEANPIAVDYQDNLARPPCEKFTCYYCKKEFRSKLKLVKHREKIHFSRPFQCKLCFDWFSSKGELALHREQKCPLQNQQFILTLDNNPSNSEPGILTSTSDLTKLAGVNLTECEICQKKFISKQAVTRHHNDDHQGYKCMCEFCHAKFFSEQAKKYHLRRKCPVGKYAPASTFLR